jgi:hypothetical protein
MNTVSRHFLDRSDKETELELELVVESSNHHHQRHDQKKFWEFVVLEKNSVCVRRSEELWTHK